MGGIPCDNNALESSNNVDKGLLSRETATATEFIADLATKVVGPLSASDTQFLGSLKERSTTKASVFNNAPNNHKFFDHVRAQWYIFNEDEEDDSVTRDTARPHILRFPKHYNNPDVGIPRGSYIFISDHGIADFQSYMVDTPYNPDRVGDVKAFMKEQNWTWLISALLDSPETTVEQEDMTFDEFAEWMRCFYVFRPIRFHKTNWDHPTNRSLVHWLEMLKCSGFQVCDKEEILAHPKKKTFYSCTCEMYLHYLVCKHVLLVYLQNGIVERLPKGPKSLLSRKAGRKRKAKGGDALLRQETDA